MCNVYAAVFCIHWNLILIRMEFSISHHFGQRYNPNLEKGDNIF